MAIDTAEKQVSFLHFHSTSRNMPLPNGAYDQSDWQTLLGRYGGISWTEISINYGHKLYLSKENNTPILSKENNTQYLSKENNTLRLSK